MPLDLPTERDRDYEDPDVVTYKAHGLTYKIGRHGLIFYRRNGRWAKSTKSIEELETALNRKKPLKDWIVIPRSEPDK